MRKAILYILLILTNGLVAQSEKMQVTRCEAVNNRSAIKNIYVDENNIKWVSNTEGLFKVYDLSYSEKVKISANEESLLNLPGGNADIRWQKSDLNEALGGVLNNSNTITTTFYDAERDELWVGTKESGLFKLNTDPGLRKVEQLDNTNSKLRSNRINKVIIDSLGRKWVGTEEGLFVNKKGKWELLEKYFDIRSVAVGPSGVWLLTNQYIGKLDRKEDWYPIELPARTTEGPLRDLSFDKLGKLWVVSDVITSYDPETEDVGYFGPAQYFTSEFASGLSPDQAEGIWVATEDKGLFLIEKASNLSVNIIIEKALSCVPNAADAELYARVIGGAAPYKYEWSDGSAKDKLSGLSSGEYALTVTDSRGRKKLSKFEIPNPNVTANIKLIKTESDVGAADGSATVMAEGGTGTYTYAWDNGEFTVTAENLKEGKHDVTVTDENGCSTTASILISQDVKPMVAKIEESKAIDCPGGSNGVLQAYVEGGKAPYVYKWNNGKEGATINQLNAGAYEVTIIDAQEGEIVVNAELSDPSGIRANATPTGPATTQQADGKATVIASGGYGEYSYKWDNGETEADANRLTSGIHEVTVTDEKNCLIVVEVNITEEVLPLSVAIRQTAAVKCYGEGQGGITAIPAGGKSPFTFSWSNGSTGANLNNIPGGTYTVTIVDTEGTSVTQSFELDQPGKLEANIEVIQAASTDASDGQARIKLKGGTPKFNFSWDNGEITEEANRLAAGTHTVSITDQNNCKTEASVEITENILPLVAEVEQVSEINCFGEENGALNVTTGGGKSPYSYQWSNGQTEVNIANLAAGNYTVTVTDALGTKKAVSYSLKAPQSLVANAQLDNPATTGESNGVATVSVSGGAEPYTYSWDTGEKFATARQLAPGTHGVTVTDENGCTASAKVEVNENIQAITAKASIVSQINCNKEETAEVSIEIRGGKGPYQIKWINQDLASKMGTPTVDELTKYTTKVEGIGVGSYQAQVVDALNNSSRITFNVQEPSPIIAKISDIKPASTDNSDGNATASAYGGTGDITFEWDNGENTATATQLAPGKHMVTATDQNGCQTTQEVDITENILALNASLKLDKAIDCNGNKNAAISLSIDGGKKPYNISWSDANLSGEQLNGLGAGEYTVTIRDAVNNETITKINIPDPSPITFKFISNKPASTDKSNGSAIINGSGGTGSLTYAWDNGENGRSAKSLAPGEHNVTITDENNCATTATTEITENILPLRGTLSIVKPISCYGQEDAEVEITLSGGKKPYTVNWNTPGKEGLKITQLSPGTYAATVTDVTGQSFNKEVTIDSVSELKIIAAAGSPTKSETIANGKASVRVFGGTYPYFYNWDNGEQKNIATKLGYGKHTIEVKDKNGCVTTDEVFIDKRKIPDLALDELEEGKKIQMEAMQFGADQTEVTEDYYPVLNELFEFLKSNRTVDIEIGGHTNSLPPDDYCDELSTARAKAVADYLIGKGISRTRVLFRGYGKRNPIASNETLEGRKKNQRIEIKILEL